MNVRRILHSLAALGLLALGTSAHAAVALSLVADQPAYLVNATVTVKVQMGASGTEVWGGQFFLTYDSSKLQFLSAGPGDAPFTQPVYSSATIPNIDYAVGAANFTVNGATAPTTMAVLTFKAINPVASTAGLVSFRSHSPATRLTDSNATEVASTPSNLAAISIAAWSGTDAWVDDNYVGLPNGTVVNWPADGNPGPHAIGVDAFATIQGGVNAVSNNGTVHVAAGTYADTNVSGRNGLNIEGAGAATTTVVGSHNSGDPYTFYVQSGSNNTLSGFTITRSGNTPALWNSNVKSGGLNVSNTTGTVVRDCVITGNRNGLYMENNSSATIRNNVIDNNRTGLHMVAANTGGTVAENAITNNWTDGVLFRTESVSNDTTGTKFVGNNISGNWFGQIEYREDFTAMPKDFSGNWLGTTSPSVVATSGGEDPYATQIPVIFGGSSTPPGGQPDIKGNASAQFDITPMLSSGLDTDSGTYADSNGFQGDFSHLIATTQLAQTGATGRVQEGVNLIANGTLTGGARLLDVRAGTYKDNPIVNKALTIAGPNAGTAGSAGRAPEAIIVTNGPSNAVIMVTASNITLDGLKIDGDDPLATGGATYAGTDGNTYFGISNYVQGPGTVFPVSGLTVQNSIITNTFMGIRLNGGAASTGNTITRNWFDAIGNFDFGYAVSLRFHFYADVTNNLMTRCLSGVHTSVHSLAGPAVWSITGNEIHSYGAGICSWGIDTGAATGATITGNQLSAETTPAPIADNAGIIIFYLQGPLTTISGNTISDHDHGIVVTGAFSSGANTLSIGANTITNPKTTGVLFSNNVTFNPIGTSNLNTAAYTFPTALNVNGLTINGALKDGIVVKTTGPSTALASITGTHADGTGAAGFSGVSVDGALASASIVANPTTFTGFDYGIQVSGGAARIQTTNLTGNSSAAIRVLNNAKVDAGDCSASDFTGLGSSSGGNTLTGYGFDNAAPFAVLNDNASGGFNVYAQNNNYGAGPSDNIAALVWDSADNAALSTVLYSQNGGQAITAAVASNDYCNFNVPSSVTFTATYSGPGTIEWRDGTCGGTLIGSGNPFVWNTPPSAAGVHTYYASVNDGCAVQCASTTITVHAAPVITANVSLSGITSGTFTRCITFDLFEAMNCPGPAFTHGEPVTFTNGSGTVSFTAPCGTYACITARDRLHTLRRTIDAGNFHPSGNDYTVDFNGSDALISGNVNDDNFIDILDFGGFIGRYSLADLANTTCSTTGLHPDFDGNGLVGTEDFNFISFNFLAQREADCCSNPLADGQPTVEISVIDLARTDYDMARTADLNRDGLLNTGDVAFLAQHGFSRCPADFYADGVVNVQDIFTYLDNWFAGYPAADTNNDHSIQVNDIFDYINIWFQGC